jgi:oligopeptide/dipeptide ABC transporter ATP-binding protein
VTVDLVERAHEPGTDPSHPLVELRDAKLHYPVQAGILNRPRDWVYALDGVSLAVAPGHALGLVGESGCGKTTLVNGVLQLEKLTSGRVLFEGQDLAKLSRAELRHLRRKLQVVFQDPFWSLNPRWLVRDIVGEPLRVHENLSLSDRTERVWELLSTVGLPPDAMYKYAHEFSGGMRQRIAIARALAVEPTLVVLDEPTSAIDVISQYHILAMLRDLKDRMGLTFILISHDLAVVAYLATHIAVMYLGKIVEYGRTSEVLANPVHPYTEALFAAVPDPTKRGVSSLRSIGGEVPSALHPPSGCRFHTRCPFVRDVCQRDEPPRVDLRDEHWATCWLQKSGASM